jgi:hypothetical protein
MMRLRRVTAFTGFDCRNRILSDARRHRAVAAPEKATAGHPNQNGDGQQQAQQFVREEQTHRYPKSTPSHEKVQAIRQSFVPFAAHFCNGSLASLETSGET